MMKNERQIYALGFFDGVHLGHQALLKACTDLAAQQNCSAAAITFDAHPQSLFTTQVPTLISTIEDRSALLRAYGIEQIHCFPVTREVMSTSWEDFLIHLLQQGAAGFVCGHDFRFGRKGEGDAAKLRTFCAAHHLPCVIVPEQTLKGQRISSTLIRGLIEQGDMQTAIKFLGHPHLLTGCVMHGQKLGRTLGIPTANLVIPAGEYSIDYLVRLKRTPALKQGKKMISLSLLANEHFALPVSNIVQVADTVSVLDLRIYFSDMFTQAPSAWDSNLLGEFTQQKFELICKVLGINPADFNDASVITLAKQLYISVEMTAYVEAERQKKLKGEEYDENAFDYKTGEPLTFRK